MMERRTMRGLEIRAETVSDGHTVELQLITPTCDDFGTLWNARALDKGLAEQMPTLCWSHQHHEIIGRAIDHRTSDDGPSVRFLFDDFEAVPRAKQAWSQIQPREYEGRMLPPSVTDCSIGFERVPGGTVNPTQEQRSAWRGVKEYVREAIARETSLVLAGSVTGAKVLAVRSAAGVVGEVSEDLVLDLARQVHAGTLTYDVARTALDLAAGQPSPGPLGDVAATPGSAPGPDGPGGGLEPDQAAEIEAALDEALGDL